MSSPGLTPEQCRMARGALHWTVRQLAIEAELASNTVLAFEQGRSVRDSTPARIRQVFEQYGIRFLMNGHSVSVEVEHQVSD